MRQQVRFVHAERASLLRFCKQAVLVVKGWRKSRTNESCFIYPFRT